MTKAEYEKTLKSIVCQKTTGTHFMVPAQEMAQQLVNNMYVEYVENLDKYIGAAVEAKAKYAYLNFNMGNALSIERFKNFIIVRLFINKERHGYSSLVTEGEMSGIINYVKGNPKYLSYKRYVDRLAQFGVDDDDEPISFDFQAQA